MDDITPTTLEGWGNFNWTQYIGRDQDTATRKLMERIEIVSVLADQKIRYQSDSAALRMLAAIYRPLARFRLNIIGIHGCLNTGCVNGWGIMLNIILTYINRFSTIFFH